MRKEAIVSARGIGAALIFCILATLVFLSRPTHGSGDRVQQEAQSATASAPNSLDEAQRAKSISLARAMPGLPFADELTVAAVDPMFAERSASIAGGVVTFNLRAPFTGPVDLPGYRFGGDQRELRVEHVVRYHVVALRQLEVFVDFQLDRAVSAQPVIEFTQPTPADPGSVKPTNVLSTELVSERRADGSDLPVPPETESRH